MAFWKRQNYRYKNQISGCQWLGVGVEVDGKRNQVILGGDGPFLGCSDGYLTAGICQNSKTCTLKITNYTYMYDMYKIVNFTLYIYKMINFTLYIFNIYIDIISISIYYLSTCLFLEDNIGANL